MKPTTKTAALLCLTALTGLLPACSNSIEGGAVVAPPAQLSVEKYPVSGVLADPSGAPISGTIALSATDSTGAPVTLFANSTGGTPITTVSVSSAGMISFYVPNTASLPVTVKAIGTSAGRVSSSALITVDKVGASSFIIKLVDPSALATAGVASDTSNQTASATTGLSGALVADVVTGADVTKTSAVVTIPQSTILTDSTGAALSGTLTATVTTFAPPAASTTITADNAMQASPLENFPGGLDNVLITAASAQAPAQAAGAFASAGFVAVSVKDSTGKTATNSNTPFTVRMDIPAGTINDETGVAVVAGDLIPIWTYNETTAAWKAEVDAAGNQVMGLVKLDAVTNGNYVEYSTNHFSYWNLDWFSGQTCVGRLNLTGDAIKLPFQLKATFSNGAGYLYTGTKTSGDASLIAARVPRNRLMNIFLIEPVTSKVVASLTNVNWCAQTNQTITMNYVAPAAAKPVDAVVTVSEYCAQNPNVTRVVPSAPLTMQVGTSYFNGTTGTNGSFTFNLTPGTYNVFAYNRASRSYDRRSDVVINSSTGAISFRNAVQCTPAGSGSTGTGSTQWNF